MVEAQLLRLSIPLIPSNYAGLLHTHCLPDLTSELLHVNNSVPIQVQHVKVLANFFESCCHLGLQERHNHREVSGIMFLEQTQVLRYIIWGSSAGLG